MRACKSLARRFACSKSSRDAMNFLPCPAQFGQVVRQDVQYVSGLAPRESIVLPESYRSCRATQIEYRFAARPNRGPAGDHSGRSQPAPINSENRGHLSILPDFLSAWVKMHSLPSVAGSRSEEHTSEL